MVVDELYYGPQGAAPTDAAALPIDLSKAVQAALKRIYRKEIDPEREIDPGLWQGVVDTIDLAAAEGLKRHPGVKYDFKRQLLHNDQVFAAFKVHRLQGDMARQMVDAQGDVKSFEQWAQDVRPIASHQCRQWLRTEYDTAVKRASLAADWQRFEDEKDVLPNLRWIPSTAANPDAFHQSMWDTVLPVDHPFWGAHHPGDRWGCQCALEATDDPATATPTVDYRTSPGLENNPGRDAKLFNDTHPYFPDSCDRCPFHGNHTSGPTNLAKDCYHCSYIEQVLPDNTVVVSGIPKKYEDFGRGWVKEFQEGDGFLVTEEARIPEKHSGNEWEKYQMEHAMCVNFAKAGHTIIYLRERPGLYDILCDGLPAELKKTVQEHRHYLHQHAELSYQEYETTAYLVAKLREYGLEVQTFSDYTGCIATVRGAFPGKTVLLRADIDALPIQEESGVEFESIHPGVMHACGHDCHASMLLGAAQMLQEARNTIHGTVKLLFQAAEEAFYGARYYWDQGYLNDVDAALGMHVWPTLDRKSTRLNSSH